MNALGGFKVQGKSSIAAQQLLADALALQESGVSAVVIESVPDLLGIIIIIILKKSLIKKIFKNFLEFFEFFLNILPILFIKIN